MHPDITASDIIRFLSLIRRTESCWLWQANTSRKGYGRFSVAANGKKRLLQAHRFSWELFHGPVRDGMLVCHNCPGGDNPACVNPDHLFLGTNSENITDMYRKRQDRPQDYRRETLRRVRRQSGLYPNERPHGEGHPQARLKEADVLEIRRLWQSKALDGMQIATRFNVGRSTVCDIVKRRSWAYLPEQGA